MFLFSIQDSFLSAEGLLLALTKEDDKFTREAFKRQNVGYDNVLDAVKKTRTRSGVDFRCLRCTTTTIPTAP